MKVGILGAGQLSQMLCLAAHPLGLEPWILAPTPQDSAWTVAHGVLGNPGQINDLQKFTQKLEPGPSLLTFESEFYSALTLSQGLTSSHSRIFPRLSALGILQDRKTQKEWMEQSQLRTSPFIEVNSEADLTRAENEFGSFVLKLRTHGYDGKGTFYFRNSKSEWSRLTSLLNQHPQGFIAEKFISFRRELALMAFRSENGSFAFFPMVESIQKDSRCDLVLGPTKHPRAPALQKRIQQALEALEYVGAIAFELFDDGANLWVNEVAPRVHNSGHFSQDALNWDQFSLHWLCGLGEDLPKILARSKAYGMINLIGETGEIPHWDFPQSARLHWYHKQENRPGRKMGHLNLTGTTKTQIRKTLLTERKKFYL